MTERNRKERHLVSTANAVSATPTSTLSERFLALVQTIVIVRHAKAPKMSPDQPDEDRMVNQAGHDQAKKLAEKLQGFDFDIVLSSPLKRVKQTLAIATNGRYPVTEVSELNCPPKGSSIDIMFNELGYVPLAKYFEHPFGEHLKEYGRAAFAAVMRNLPETPRQQVLVGGHAVLLNALVWATAEAMEEYFGAGVAVAKKMALTEILNDAEAFRLTPGFGTILPCVLHEEHIITLD